MLCWRFLIMVMWNWRLSYCSILSNTDTPALPKEQNDKLFYAVLEDYADITVKRERMKKMKLTSFTMTLPSEI